MGHPELLPFQQLERQKPEDSVSLALTSLGSRSQGKRDWVQNQLEQENH